MPNWPLQQLADARRRKQTYANCARQGCAGRVPIAKKDAKGSVRALCAKCESERQAMSRAQALEEAGKDMIKLSAPKAQRLYLDEAVPISKLDDGGKPQWNKLFPLGAKKFRADFPGGFIEFTRAFCETLVKNAKAVLAKGHRIQANYLHDGGVDPNPSVPLDRTVASGWIVDVELRDDGPHGLFDWTKRARGFIENDEFAYLSPEFALTYQNRDTGKPQGPTLLGAALTNTPFLKELPRVAASDTTTAEPSAKPGARMEKKLLCAALGLSEDASDEEILSASAANKAAAVKLAEVEKQNASTATKLSEQSTQIAELKVSNAKHDAEVKELKEKLAAEAKEKAEAKAESFVAKLVDEKRLKPALREKVKALALADFDIAKQQFGDLPVMQGEIGIERGTADSEKKKLEDAYWLEVTKLTDKGVDFAAACGRVNRSHPELSASVVVHLTDEVRARAR